MALSPDGEILVYVARHGDVDQLFRRSMNALDSVPIDGTEGAEMPFFSPDGQSVGFFADGALKRGVAIVDLTPIKTGRCRMPGLADSWTREEEEGRATQTRQTRQRRLGRVGSSRLPQGLLRCPPGVGLTSCRSGRGRLRRTSSFRLRGADR